MNCTPPGFSVHGISQARILEWVVIFFSRGSSRPRDQTLISCIGRWIFFLPLNHLGSPNLAEIKSDRKTLPISQRLCFLNLLSQIFAAAKLLQSCPTLCDPIDGSSPGPLSLGFSRQEYWSGLPFPSPRHACLLSCFSHVRLCATLWKQPTRLLCPQDSLGKNTGVGCHFLL